MINIIKVLFISALPFIELKGAIPVGIAVYNLNMWEAFIISYLGSTLSGLIIICYFPRFLDLLRKNSKIRMSERTLLDRTNKKLKLKVKKYGAIGLLLFVAIPLPGTGVYSASVASVLLRIDRVKASVAIILGNFIAGIIILAITQYTSNMLT